MLQLEPGYTVDRYRLVEKLGEGGMAVVYRVEHATLGTPHALKVLTMGGRQVKDRLVQEGRVQATLQHPHIVAVTDVLDIEGSPGLLMEYVDGPAMDEWLAKYKPTVEEAVVVFRAIVAGVGQAHARGLIHRDLKPGNVMLQVTDQGVVPKVADFGLAKVTDDSGGGGSMKRTRTGMTMGTPAYMAPEQIKDSSSVDRRADLYSLGCILYELLTGETPFQGDNMLALFAAIAVGNYTPIRERVPDVPRNVEEVIEALIVEDPDDRLADCASILDVLDGRGKNRTAMFPMNDGVLGPPAPIGEVGRTTLALNSPAADVARAMTRGVQAPTAISQARWTSNAPVSVAPATNPPTRTRDPDAQPAGATVSVTTMEPAPDDSFDASTSMVRPVARGAMGVAFLGGAGLIVFGGAVVASILVALFVFAPGSTDTPEPAPVADPRPVAAPDPAPAPDPVPATPDPVPTTPDPVPAVPDPAPVRPDPAPVRPDPAPVRPDPAPTRPVPRPDPVPAPPPVPEAPRPAPVAPAPAPKVTGGTFAFSGDVRGVVLKDTASGRTYSAGQTVPPGSYRVIVDGAFGGSTVTVREGQHLDLKCVGVMNSCRAQ